MCGPSSAEKSLQASSANFASMLQQNYSTLFGKQLDVLNAVNRSLSPIFSAGPNQMGFSGPELAARNTQAINAAAAASRSAQQAARTFGAGQGGGGTSGITSGITKQIQSAIASQGAQALAQREGDIMTQSYETGRENYWRAEGGMQALAGGYSPNAAQSGAISANQESFQQAKTIHEQEQEASQMIAGGITGLAGAAAGFATGGIANLGGGGWDLSAFMKGGMESLGGRG